MSDSRQTRGVLLHQNRAMTPAAASKQDAATPPVDVAALAAALITVTLWGSAFVGIRAAGQTFSPGGLAVGRLLVSTAVLGAVMLFRRQPLPQRRDPASIAVYGVLWLGVYSVALNAAERLVDAGTAAMLIASGPILIAFAGWLPRKTRRSLAMTPTCSQPASTTPAARCSRRWTPSGLLGNRPHQSSQLLARRSGSGPALTAKWGNTRSIPGSRFMPRTVTTTPTRSAEP
jgi:hypothetical protein